MALEAQPSPPPHRSPPEAADAAADRPLTLTRETGNEWAGTEKPPASATHSPPPLLSTAVVVASEPRVAAAKYVPPRAATRTADPDPGRAGGGSAGWYSWSGGRAAAPASRSRRDPPPPAPRQRAAEAPPPPPPASAPALPPAPISAPTRSVDRVVPTSLSRKRRAAAMQRTALVARGAAAVLCLAALAVLAADTRKGWALDSYSRYSQFRYSEAVNVIGFVYSVFQFASLAELMRKNKHLIPHPRRDLFDFATDQVLAYLLISSSSSATARVGDLIDNWGSDPFPNMANGSIAVSFMAFLVFAICSLISAYNLSRQDM